MFNKHFNFTRTANQNYLIFHPTLVIVLAIKKARTDAAKGIDK